MWLVLYIYHMSSRPNYLICQEFYNVSLSLKSNEVKQISLDVGRSFQWDNLQQTFLDTETLKYVHRHIELLAQIAETVDQIFIAIMQPRCQFHSRRCGRLRIMSHRQHGTVSAAAVSVLLGKIELADKSQCLRGLKRMPQSKWPHKSFPPLSSVPRSSSQYVHIRRSGDKWRLNDTKTTCGSVNRRHTLTAS